MIRNFKEVSQPTNLRSHGFRMRGNGENAALGTGLRLALVAAVLGFVLHAAADSQQGNQSSGEQSTSQGQSEPLARETQPFLSTDYFKALSEYLRNPSVYDINGVSFEDYMKQKGYKVVIEILPLPQAGKVVDKKGLKTRELPTTEGLTGALDRSLWLRYGKELSWNLEVSVQDKFDGSEVSRHAAMPHEYGWKFNAISATETGKPVTYIQRAQPPTTQ